VRTIIILAALLALGCNRSRQTPPTQASGAKPQAGQTQLTSTVQVHLVPAAQSPTPIAEQTPPAIQDETAAEEAPQVTKHDDETPLLLEGQTYHFVAHVAQIEHADPHRGDNITVESWELRDPSGVLAYRDTEKPVTPAVSGGGFESTVSADASVIKGKHGSLVLVEGDSEPSAPDSGGWAEFFSLQHGKLKPLKPSVSANEFLGMDTDPLRGGADILKFRIWTGNFSVIYLVLINWDSGTLQPARMCLRMASGGRQVERCPYEVKADPRDITEQTFVRLYNEPEEELMPKHVVVQPGSRVEFIAAEVHVDWKGTAQDVGLEVKPDDVWLKIRVDGKEGWVHTQEDFAELGLGFSG
jgi:hypothetical protein